MRFSELFDGDLNPLWDRIWEIGPFKACVGVNQNKEWHRENVDEHVFKVTTKMKEFVCGGAPDFLSIDKGHGLMLMSAALCHDLGKPSTTYWDEGLSQWKCRSHGAVGEKAVRRLFFDEPDIFLREDVCWLTRYHMALHNSEGLDDVEVGRKIARLSRTWGGIDFDDVLALYLCDCFGCDNAKNDDGGYASDVEFARKCKGIYETEVKGWIPPYETDDSDVDVIVMVGIAGSGKSTWAASKEGFEVISRDSIREELGMVSPDGKCRGSHSQEEKVTEVYNERIRKYAEEGKRFIIDNMNLVEKYRRAYKEVLKDFSLKYEYVYVEAPTLEECKRRRDGQISGKEIDRMLDRLEFPRPYEFDCYGFVKQSV